VAAGLLAFEPQVCLSEPSEPASAYLAIDSADQSTMPPTLLIKKKKKRRRRRSQHYLISQFSYPEN